MRRLLAMATFEAGSWDGDFRPVEVVRVKSLNGSKPAEIGHTLLIGETRTTGNEQVVFSGASGRVGNALAVKVIAGTGASRC